MPGTAAPHEVAGHEDATHGGQPLEVAKGQPPSPSGFSSLFANEGASAALQGGQPSDQEGKSSGGSDQELSEEEKKQVSDLRKRDAEVRAHENAHAAAGGTHAGSPSYEMQRGPDGKSYAVGGEVAIDTSAESTPQATVRKMDTVIRAALAPADPSSQDQKVAAAARQARVAAQVEVRKERAEELSGDDEGDGEVAAAGEASQSDETSEPQAAQDVGSSTVAGDAQAQTQNDIGADTASRGAGLTRNEGVGAASGTGIEAPDFEPKPIGRGIFGNVGGSAGSGAPIFAGSGALIGFDESDGDPSAAPAPVDAGVRLAASRAYRDSETDAVFQALSRL